MNNFNWQFCFALLKTIVAVPKRKKEKKNNPL